MAILNKDEYMGRIAEVIRDNDDSSLQTIEDFTDTYNDLYNRAENNRSVEEVENEWREKYRKRFFESDDTIKKIVKSNKDDLEKEKLKDDVTIEELFEESED